MINLPPRARNPLKSAECAEMLFHADRGNWALVAYILGASRLKSNCSRKFNARCGSASRGVGGVVKTDAREGPPNTTFKLGGPPSPPSFQTRQPGEAMPVSHGQSV